MKLPVPLSFDWGRGNIDKNWRKHKVHFKEAEEIFLNKPLKTYKDIGHSQTEDRYIALGITNQDRALNISFTIRNNSTRVISARDQSKKERKIYDKTKKSK